MEVYPVVIDAGSSLCKGGYAGDDAPRAVFPTMIGRPNRKSTNDNSLDVYVGEEPEHKRHDHLLPTFPIKGGRVVDWDGMEKIWHHVIYEELRTSSPEDCPVLLTESVMNTKASREKMAQIMFESIGINALIIASQPVLTLYSTSRVSGIVLESGDESSTVTPIYEGISLKQGIIELNLAGSDVSNYLEKLLFESGQSNIEEDSIKYIKENACRVAIDFESEMKNLSENQTKFELPDGSSLTIGPNEILNCAEIMFQPSLIGMEDNGVHELVFRSIGYCELDVRKEMYSNIVLGGGNTMFNGFTERMNKEVTGLAPSSMNIEIVALPDRKYSAWNGGSILASMESSMWILKEEFEEFGPEIVHRKC